MALTFQHLFTFSISRHFLRVWKVERGREGKKDNHLEWFSIQFNRLPLVFSMWLFENSPNLNEEDNTRIQADLTQEDYHGRWQQEEKIWTCKSAPKPFKFASFFTVSMFQFWCKHFRNTFFSLFFNLSKSLLAMFAVLISVSR